jgi:hypothetical protein
MSLHPIKQVYVVHCADGQNVALGPAQIAWLVAEGHIVQAPDDQQAADVDLYLCHSMTGLDLNDLVMSQPHLRECDFCRMQNCRWEVRCRPFTLEKGILAGSPFGGKHRPVVCCDECQQLVRANRKFELIDRAIMGTLESARRGGGLAAAVVQSNTHMALRRQIEPLVKDIVTQTFHNREGFPVRWDG